MGFLRKIFSNDHGRGHGQEYDQWGRNKHHRRYRPEDHDDTRERWGGHAGSIPALPPDSICPLCRKSNPPGTRACKQCGTALDLQKCARCSAALLRGAAFCVRCGQRAD
ncbi:Double zinc ribbon [Caballeronia catudaia]|uniref:Double zinc ribbon n=1 Tax=Caballeronia catudaia TaxID=1777136 RepID=A0A158B2X5_9BURK|nr:zinc ribbon domain-containing protein [Caballeronia catudaia]SAK64373.1 Double zinc ribbon [Caballeronia catudaia]